MTVSHPILMVSQDAKLVENVKSNMKSREYNVVCQESSSEAIATVKETPPVMVLVEKAMPDRNGFSICQEMRKTYAGPLIFLTEEKDDVDELFAFEIGADDCINRSVNPKLLIARMFALLKRSGRVMIPSRSEVNIGDLKVMPSKREAYLKGQPIHLTSLEFDLLWYFVSHSGTVVSRDDLSHLLYNKEYNGIDRSIDVYVSRIRQKLGDAPADPVYVKTVRGIGYLFTGP